MNSVIKNYLDLIRTIYPLDRCHCGPEMHDAYKILTTYYNGSRMIFYPCGQNIFNWTIPPFWSCDEAYLKDSSGKIIADKSRNNLEVFSYSPSFEGKVSLDKLLDHVISDPARPDSILFHFHNQYRHWKPKWGFSITHNKLKKLKDTTYYVKINSKFDNSKKMVQADFSHKGTTNKEFLFMGHFDHPSCVNDGLAGCIAAFEVINRLKGRKTKYSYRAFASVEIVGSVAYLFHEEKLRKNFIEGMFLGFSGIANPIVYQQTFHKNSLIDKAIKHLFRYEKNNSKSKNIFEHRELAGNDENVFDSIGYDIPMGTLMRHPFPDYHTNHDNMEITRKKNIEEIICLTMKLIDILEQNTIIKANYNGIPCLSDPSINLYLGSSKISGIKNSNQLKEIGFDSSIYKSELKYVKENSNLLYGFMNNVIRLADGVNTILDICELSKIPFYFGLSYIKELEKKKLVKFIEPLS